MASKMSILKFIVLCVMPNSIFCESLTIVLDTTISMQEDVDVIKSNIRSVLDAVSLAPHIDEFVLVPFGDPDLGNPITTKSPEDFLSAINAIETSGGIDCPENSLAGIRKGLEISKPDSYIYVFTDAFAKDYKHVSVVKDLCKTTRSKVAIFLSGYCLGREGTIDIYKNITQQCSGAVFHLDASNFRKAFQFMKEMTAVEWNSVQSFAPIADHFQFQVSMDHFTTNMMLVATGKKPMIIVQDCEECEVVMRDPTSFLVLRVKPHIGTYRATLRCETCFSLTVYKRLTLQFEYGFSPRFAKNIKETSLKPLPDLKDDECGDRMDELCIKCLLYADDHVILADSEEELQKIIAGINNYITIFLTNMDGVSVESMELHSGGSVSNLHLEQVADRPGCYYSTAFITDHKRYRLVVQGYDSSTSQRLTGSTKKLSPQRTGFVPASMAPVNEIIAPDSTLIELGASITVACKITAYPEPQIRWEDSNSQKLRSEEVLLETPAVYISYVTIDNFASNSTIYCKAKNWDGDASQDLDLFVNRSAVLEFVQEPEDETFEYGRRGQLYCQVNSYPEATMKWYHNDTLLENSDNIDIKPEDNAVVIRNMGLEDVGEYKCEVSNTVETKDATAVVSISGLEYPEIETDNSEIFTDPGVWTSIQCRIVKGNPPPQMSWQYKSDNNDEFSDNIPNSHLDEKLFSIKIYNTTGVYKCKGSNILGEDYKEIVVKIKSPPRILNGDDENITVKERNKIELPCQVEFNPNTNVRWEISQGDVITPLSHRHHIDSKNTLRFNALLNDSGNYHCIAENEFGRADKTYTVTVLVAPYIETPASRVITTSVGSTLALSCNVLFGNPVPSTRWEFITRNSLPTTLSRGDSTNVLTLNDITKAQEGIYSCIANNTVGVDKIKIVVNVR